VTPAAMTEYLTPEPARGLAGLLDLPTGSIVDGWQLPPLWRWVYLLKRPAQPTLGPEGHPAHGIPEPPRPGLHRMYAGGRVTTHRPLRLPSADAPSPRTETSGAAEEEQSPLPLLRPDVQRTPHPLRRRLLP
jgi:3-methylfumaryl-CoA hydratase